MAQVSRLSHQLARISAGHPEEDDQVMEAAEAVLGHDTIEAVTNNLTSLSSSSSRDNLKVRSELTMDEVHE